MLLGNMGVLKIMINALKKDFPFENELKKQIDCKDNFGDTPLKTAFEAEVHIQYKQKSDTEKCYSQRMTVNN